MAITKAPMGSLKQKIKQLEVRAGVHYKEIPVYIITRGEDSLLKDYFKDQAEEDAYIDWRIARLKEECQLPFLIYTASAEDVETNLEAFRINKEVSGDPPGTDGAVHNSP